MFIILLNNSHLNVFVLN